MIAKKIDLINTAIDFIKTNNLGVTDCFDLEEKEFSDIEKNRLDYLIDICNNLINEKISLTNLKPIIKDKLQISEDLAIEITEKIKTVLSEEEVITENNIEGREEKENSAEINKKSIFSTIINKK
jgi:hypothetical protein